MRLIKYTHACVRLERGGNVLVVDPGIWSETEALDGANAVLVTHEHFDHIDYDRLRAACKADPELRIWTNADVAAQLAELGRAVTAVASGEDFEAAGFAVHACGDRHAYTFEKLPDAANLGYLVDGVYHPGDAFHVPQAEVETLLVPTAAPWLKVGEAIEFVRRVAPRRAYSIHDAILTEAGQELTDRWMSENSNTDYRRLAVGASVDL
jgi:L-ascorbate metabolism protein UlaG (beta-lactamase superfamily)